MNKNSVIGILAVAAISLMVGIWIGQTKEIFMSELDQAAQIPGIQKKAPAPMGDMMVPEMAEMAMPEANLETTMVPATNEAVAPAVVENAPAN